MNCPNCGSDCIRDEVDIGVGTVHSPWACPNCGWDMAKEVDELFKKGEELE